ncbi:hypothetical membrane protein [Corynebacterium kutscheri]|uniref:Hypothetical membrane protein n=1 Tax=Corynebacterium kutscheri TaxID=35755 RepID=A0A0F6TD68_9CORY|nr:DUF3093 domain-containing protein [Corynebacterium kutscheri]AKE41369.1 Protein of unknown function (DUF3093) [Corynebacterium kutscheri]VEH08646.1 hypothetical membrane protein [Corynebacterium kutscheri]VEH09693.1 hypothetical membrane protein [Corynebacterium kutscheri]VEH79775.1 hypothetical membrane protein [Corynebacterium kutscheri]
MTSSTDNDSTHPQASGQVKVLYSERQWVPWYWWIAAALLVALLSAQFALNRTMAWLYIPAIVLSIVAVWVLLNMSKTILKVEEDPDGTRWLVSNTANLPHTVVARSLAVPATAKRNAMGRQLDPAAFLISHSWVPEMVMLVLDDPEDPTPYWLVGTKNPEALLKAFLPNQYETAIKTLTN